jgi:hypothetical protein
MHQHNFIHRDLKPAVRDHPERGLLITLVPYLLTPSRRICSSSTSHQKTGGSKSVTLASASDRPA